MDPTERWTRLTGRHLTIVEALIDRHLELLGVDVSPRRLRNSREVLAHATPEELEALYGQLGEEVLRRWRLTPEQDREGPEG